MSPGRSFPLPLDAYAGEQGLSLASLLCERVRVEPLNAVATALFALAVLHTLLAPAVAAAARRQRERLERERGPGAYSLRVEALHLLGEVEVVFGLWALPLLGLVAAARGPRAAAAFLERVDFTEPFFVFAIMAIASTRPVLAAAERLLGLFARLGRGTPLAWWFAALTVGPLLGSLITEPGAMIICALLLGRRVFALQPSLRLRYATVGLLFVNVSVGGTLTPFAAPPVLLVADAFGWDLRFMLVHFGWKAAVGIALATLGYALLFRGELRSLAARERSRQEGRAGSGAAAIGPVPAWVMLVHLGFLALVVLGAHTPALFLGAFLFFLAFHGATTPHQAPLDLRPPLLVGFFLAGLVVHGALQQWWIAPLLGRLAPLPLFLSALLLTSFNDNAAITYLASQVPGLSLQARIAVVAGAVSGGGLTVMANAPNPAGQAALAPHFPEGLAPLRLLAGALFPTLVVALALLLLP